MFSVNHPQERPTLVLGGTGKTGGRVAARLAGLGLPVRVASRSAATSFDWQNRASWEPALRGAGAVYLSYFPDLAIAGAVETVGALVDSARRSEVDRIVLLSGRGEEEAERAERVVRSTGVAWTIVRAAWFAQNFSEGYLRDGVLSGEVVLPKSEVGEPFIDADDIADVAVAALTDDRHNGQLYELTGPRLLTFEQAVQEIATAVGRRIQYKPVSLQSHHAMLQDLGVPADFVWLLDYLFSTVLDGRNARIGDGVKRALGRPPRDFAEFARSAAAAGAWAL